MFYSWHKIAIGHGQGFLLQIEWRNANSIRWQPNPARGAPSSSNLTMDEGLMTS